MWITLLVMGIAVSLEPIRIGLTVLMLSRPRPMLQLFAFLCGGFTMGVGGGLAIIFALRATPLAESGFTVHHVQIGIGILALVIAIGLAANISRPKFLRRSRTETMVPAEGGAADPETLPGKAFAGVSNRARSVMQSSSPWIAGISGLGIALPSVDYLAAMAVIIASGEPPALQVAALVSFNVVAFALIEIPLLSYLIAPDRTLATMTSLNVWIRSRSRRDVAILLAGAGIFMLTLGIIGPLG